MLHESHQNHYNSIHRVSFFSRNSHIDFVEYFQIKISENSVFSFQFRNSFELWGMSSNNNNHSSPNKIFNLVETMYHQIFGQRKIQQDGQFYWKEFSSKISKLIRILWEIRDLYHFLTIYKSKQYFFFFLSYFFSNLFDYQWVNRGEQTSNERLLYSDGAKCGELSSPI